MKISNRELTMTALMLALALVFQIAFRAFAQPLVGPLINMTLILTVLYIGVWSGTFVGALTPIVAFTLGIIPVPILAPIILVGNCLLVVMFETTTKWIKVEPWNRYIGVVVASLFKFVFLYISVRALLPLFMPKVPEPLLLSFGFSQLYTALIGGVLAMIIYTFIPKGYLNKN